MGVTVGAMFVAIGPAEEFVPSGASRMVVRMKSIYGQGIA